MTLRGTLDLVADFRAGDEATPVILMGYLNPVESYGYEAFAADAAAAGVDGLIAVSFQHLDVYKRRPLSGVWVPDSGCAASGMTERGERRLTSSPPSRTSLA